MWEHSRTAAEQIVRLLGAKKRLATEEIATLSAEEFSRVEDLESLPPAIGAEREQREQEVFAVFLTRTQHGDPGYTIFECSDLLIQRREASEEWRRRRLRRL